MQTLLKSVNFIVESSYTRPTAPISGVMIMLQVESRILLCGLIELSKLRNLRLTSNCRFNKVIMPLENAALSPCLKLLFANE